MFSKMMIVFLLPVLATVTACDAGTKTVLEEISSKTEYSTFTGWLSDQTKRNLGHIFVQRTLLIPTNHAIGNFLNTHPNLEVRHSYLQGIAEYCVVNGNVILSQLKETGRLDTGVNGPILWFNRVGNSTYINDAKVTSSIEASNGHVYEIDAVIFPITIAESLKSEMGHGKEYSGFNSLLSIATPVGDLLADSTSMFTVFSPNNAVVNDMKLTSLTAEKLSPIIRRHIVPGQVIFYNMMIGRNTRLPTLEQGEMIDVKVVDNIVYVCSGGYCSMVERGVVNAASNGVIHVINGVLGSRSGVNVYQALGLFNSSDCGTTRRKISKSTQLKTDLMDTTKMFTVFSPQNTAWDKVCISDSTTLQEVNKRHVVMGKVKIEELKPGTVLMTMSEEMLTVKKENGKVYLEIYNVTAELISTDNMASNGIIHVINKVLTNESCYNIIHRIDQIIMETNPTPNRAGGVVYISLSVSVIYLTLNLLCHHVC